MKSSVNFKDITGNKYGRLTVIKRDIDSVKVVYWFCKCICGKEKRIRGTHLSAGKINSCGCLRNEQSKRLIDLTGQKFGYLTVIKLRKSGTGKMTKWEVVCKCGNILIADAARLRSGKTKSCGCYRSEVTSNRLRKHATIYGRDSRLVNIYSAMRARCYNANNDKYKYYGGRGISICKEWLDNNCTFYDWSLANGYKDNLTIDRIDNDGNYCPENCRFITQEEQMQNTSNSTGAELVYIIKKDLETTKLTMKELAKKHNVSFYVLSDIKYGRTYKNIVV